MKMSIYILLVIYVLLILFHQTGNLPRGLLVFFYKNA